MTEREKEQNNQAIRESVDVRGICASIQSMKFPRFEDLADILKKFGYKLIKEDGK